MSFRSPRRSPLAVVCAWGLMSACPAEDASPDAHADFEQDRNRARASARASGKGPSDKGTSDKGPVRAGDAENSGANGDEAQAAEDGGDVVEQSFGREIERGRALTRAGEYAQAKVVFEKILRADPTQATARAELGWAAFRAGEYELAERETLGALDQADSPTRRGMLTYNLGRILEGRRDYEQATGWYRQSLRYRPNDVVARRMGSMEAREAKQVDLEQPAGGDPSPSLSALCQQLQGALCEAESACGCDIKLSDAKRGGRAKAATQAGLLHVQLGDEDLVYLALEGPDGWSAYATPGGRAKLRLQSVELREGAKTALSWVVLLTQSRGKGEDEAQTLQLCAWAHGDAKSKGWACAPPQVRKSTELEYVVRVDEGGTLVVRHKRGERVPEGGPLQPGRSSLAKLLGIL